jgi:hypothetical protein
MAQAQALLVGLVRGRQETRCGKEGSLRERSNRDKKKLSRALGNGQTAELRAVCHVAFLWSGKKWEWGSMGGKAVSKDVT